jgi:hypothetical protein
MRAAMTERNRGEAAIAGKICELLAARPPAASICPSEAARALSPAGWRALMPAVRAAARTLAAAGAIEITQRGRVLDPATTPRGAIRLRRPRTP